MSIFDFIKRSAKVMAAVAILTIPAVTLADAKDATTEEEITAALEQEGGTVYPIGVPNTVYAQYFTGRSFVCPLQAEGANVVNVTFEPGCINNWHRHLGSYQMLIGASGKGYYQIWGEEPHELLPGDTVTIPAGVIHWHGAQHTSWFQHLAVMQDGATTEWLEPVDPDEYAKLK